jgi:indole-3-glycerol phosphate synthase
MDKLTEIMAWKAQEVARVARPVRDAELQRFAQMPRRGPSFLQALNHPGRLAIISEIKRRSPSAGAIKPTANAVEQARRYHNAGVDALSILTDEKFFGGKLPDLWEVTDFLGTRSEPQPCLRKDFMIHPVQIIEAAEAGARCILLIVRALDDATMGELYRCANLAGLDSIFEIHNETDLDRALKTQAKIIGVNNRDLANFTTNLALSERLIPLMPNHITAISESGIFTPEDAARARACGADAILVGQALMECPEDQLENLVEAMRCG